MPIFCFEGPSAVGKSTTADVLKTSTGAFVVPEVNLLFDKPQDAPAEWYFERQVERSLIAQEQSKFYNTVVLDGDPFQPLWYCWAYDFIGWQSLDFMEQFYQPKVLSEQICFPDLYFVFSASEVELRRRKEMDATRRRRGFETALKMIEPQRRYFKAMQAFWPSRVCFLEARTIEINVEFIQERISSWVEDNKIKPEVLFDKTIRWLRDNKA